MMDWRYIALRIFSGLSAVFSLALAVVALKNGDWGWVIVLLFGTAFQAWVAIEKTPDIAKVAIYDATLDDDGKFSIKVPKGEFARRGLVGWLTLQLTFLVGRFVVWMLRRIVQSTYDIPSLRMQLLEYEAKEGDLVTPVCAEIIRRRIRELEEGR